MELTLRSVAGDEVYEVYEWLDPQLRERLLGNAEVLFGTEMAPYLGADQVGLNPRVAGAVRESAAEHIAAGHANHVRQLFPAVPDLLNQQAPITQRRLRRQVRLVFPQPPQRHEPV
jgi:hypothetical protein